MLNFLDGYLIREGNLNFVKLFYNKEGIYFFYNFY